MDHYDFVIYWVFTGYVIEKCPDHIETNATSLNCKSITCMDGKTFSLTFVLCLSSND